MYENLRMIFLKIVTTLVNGEKEKNVGENNGKLRFVRHHWWHTQARLDPKHFFKIQSRTLPLNFWHTLVQKSEVDVEGLDPGLG